jgi:hypothetical protein
LAGCASTPPPEPQLAAVPVDTIRLVDTVVVAAAQDQALRQEVAALHLKVLEREALLTDVRDQLDATRLEVVRAMAKIQSTASRAEAASAMAEAEVALRQLRNSDGTTMGLEEPQRLLAQSNAQFEENNHGGALYLANEAKRIASLRGRTSVSQNGRPGEVPFAAPLHVKTLTRSNVREGPGTEFGVLFTLESDTPLEAVSYVEEWLRVTDADGREGWIFRTLVGGHTE